ncbi:unnamed protein product [Cuscuta europaea]|uniref:Uncharacterized protein n=1 Tax=Cuscuta europaea TaxID=41803 RepID=A0A9P1EN04_CUSEU|nr:unnamed protein product [Cuscuta europaea]
MHSLPEAPDSPWGMRYTPLLLGIKENVVQISDHHPWATAIRRQFLHHSPCFPSPSRFGETIVTRQPSWTISRLQIDSAVNEIPLALHNLDFNVISPSQNQTSTRAFTVNSVGIMEALLSQQLIHPQTSHLDFHKKHNRRPVCVHHICEALVRGWIIKSPAVPTKHAHS